MCYVILDDVHWDEPATAINERTTAIKLFKEALQEANRFGADRYHIEWPSNNPMPGIDRIIFNNPATIVYWTDGTKTVVKAHDEEFSEEHGLAMAFARKVLETSYGTKHPRAGFKRLVREATRY